MSVPLGKEKEFDSIMAGFCATAKEQKGRLFVLVTGERDETGNSWCGDCDKAEPLIHARLKEIGASLVDCQVDRPGYKGYKCEGDTCIKQTDVTHPYRVHPGLQIKSIPTLFTWDLDTNTPTGRLVEGDCYDDKLLRNFMSSE